MARKSKKRQGRSSNAVPPARAATTPQDDPKPEICRIIDRLGHHGFVPVLFETPSGFAIFNFDGVQLFLPKAKENIWVNFVKDYMAENYIWLKEFKTFKNKADVLNRTGVKKELDEMIRRWHAPGQLLLVGKEEHKKIIESKLNINCLCDDTVMEVMWGIKHLMKSLVPCEDSELSKDDRLQMSYGMETILKRHGIVVTPEMVNEDIIESACVLYDCELCETKHSDFLTSCGECLEEVSGIDCTGWNLMKLATALKILCIPEDDVACGDPELDWTEEELFKLKTLGSDYDGILRKRTCVAVYREMVSAREILAETVNQLKVLTTETNEACEVPCTLKQETP